MRRLILMAAIVATPLAAHAQSWRPFAKSCIHEVDQAEHCGACSGSWPLWVDCIAARAYGGELPHARLEQCKQAVWDQRAAEHECALCGPDPVAATLRCAGAN